MAVHRRLPLQLLSNRNRSVLRSDRFSHANPATKEAVYPPIVASLTAKSKSAKKRLLEEHFNQVHAAVDVQEKIRLLTRIQRKKYKVYPQTFSLNADKWYQHFTKTAYISGLPDKFSIVEESKEESLPSDIQSSASSPSSAPSPIVDDKTFADIRSLVINAILQENWYVNKGKPALGRRQEHFVAPFLRSVVSGLTNTLAQHNPLLQLSCLDIEPDVNFYWLRGQWTIDRGHRKGRIEPIRFQVDDKPHSQIRIPQQLPQFIPLDAANAEVVPEIKVNPDRMPMFKSQYTNNILTGTKVPDPTRYGHTQFHLVTNRYRRDQKIRRNQEDQIEVHLRANAIASLFAWTGAQAMYQGFWTHEDVTRPFVSQAVITDGQYFSFFCYQLNTLALSSEVDADNPRKNVCWGTDGIPLYERMQDGTVVGLNDKVLNLLIQFLMNRP